jgi:hypothetical protein
LRAPVFIDFSATSAICGVVIAIDRNELDLNNIPDDPAKELKLLEQIERSDQSLQVTARAVVTPARATAAPAPTPHLSR